MRSLVLLLTISGCVFVIDPDEEQTDTESLPVSGDFDRLVVASDAGGVTVSPGDGPITADLTWTKHRPDVTVEVVAGTLTVLVQCESQRSCAADLVVPVPEDVAVEVETGAGDVRIVGLSGPSIYAETGAGEIHATDLVVLAIEVETGAGDIEVTEGLAPDRLFASSGTGDIDFTVPAGTYDVEATSGLGSVEVDAGIVDDPTSSRLLHANTGVGGVRIRVLE